MDRPETEADIASPEAAPEPHRRWLVVLRAQAGWWLLAVIVVAATVARIVMCESGPDLDSDSYGHAVAGRRMLQNPTNLAIHWVWLPLLHVVYALMTVVGLGIQGVRYWNVAVSATVPIALAVLLLRHLRQHGGETTGEARVIPWLAGALVAVEPVTLHIGSTGQTEPMFQALVVGTCLSWSLGANITTGVLLALATLTRYEAWLLPPVLFVLYWFERPRTWRRLLPVIIPGCVIAGWCLLQYLQTGELLQFMRTNSEFVRRYFVDVGYLWGDDVLAIASRYAAFVPVQVMYGLPYLLALVGLWWMFRRCQPALLWMSVVVLAFMTYGLYAKKHLGLDRHAVVLVPAYAAAMAGGLWTVVWLVLRPRLRRLVPPAAIAGGLAVLLVASQVMHRTWPRIVWQVEQQRVRYSSARAAADTLREASQSAHILCAVAEVEVLSNLPPTRFEPTGLGDASPARIRVNLERHPTVLAVAPPTRLQAIRTLGEPIYSDDWVVVLRFTRAGFARAIESREDRAQ